MTPQQKSDLCQRALTAVSAREREVCELFYGFRYGGQMSDEMVAEEMQLPRSTVNWTRLRALQIMRGVLEHG